MINGLMKTGMTLKICCPVFFLVPADDKAHGFKLGGEIQVMGYLVDLPDFGTIYRLLKQLEDEKMATSEWELHKQDLRGNFRVDSKRV